MKIIKPSFQILTEIDGPKILKALELAGRTCYKSEDKICDDSAKKFVSMLIKNGHEAMIEHFSVTVKVVCDRGVTHEIVRHRLASYAQESTRYCNYSKDKFGNQIAFIQPCWFEDDITGIYNNNLYEYATYMEAGEDVKAWMLSMQFAEDTYRDLIGSGWSPQQARSVLPNSLKTEIVITMNLREWRHFFKLRTAPTAHPQMQEIAKPILEAFLERIPVVFDDFLMEVSASAK